MRGRGKIEAWVSRTPKETEDLKTMGKINTEHKPKQTIPMEQVSSQGRKKRKESCRYRPFLYVRESLSHPVIIFVISYDVRRQSPISPDVVNAPNRAPPK
jgi:hypothetical protein